MGLPVHVVAAEAIEKDQSRPLAAFFIKQIQSVDRRERHDGVLSLNGERISHSVYGRSWRTMYSPLPICVCLRESAALFRIRLRNESIHEMISHSPIRETIMRPQFFAATLIMFAWFAVMAAVHGEPADFGKTMDGGKVELFTLKNKNGMVAKIMTLGATLVELHVLDKAGKTADVVLGFDTVAGYESDDNQYFGCTTGRVCNRIAKGKMTVDGNTYKLAVNNGPNHLHGGGKKALSRVLWKGEEHHERQGRRRPVHLHQPRRRGRLSRQASISR